VILNVVGLLAIRAVDGKGAGGCHAPGDTETNEEDEETEGCAADVALKFKERGGEAIEQELANQGSEMDLGLGGLLIG